MYIVYVAFYKVINNYNKNFKFKNIINKIFVIIGGVLSLARILF